jgi:hypothetical protein
VALAIDASSPAVATQTSTSTSTVTTASFTPPAKSLLLIRWSWNDGGLGDNPATPSITDNLGAHLAYTLGDFQSNDVSPNVDGQVATWTAPIVTSAPMTITVTAGAGTSNHAGALYVAVLTDGGSLPRPGAHGKSGSASASSIAQSYTAQATSGQGFIITCDWSALGNETAGTGCSIESTGSPGSQISYAAVRRTAADDVAGNSNTLNVTIPGTSTALNWAYMEILPALADSGAVPTAIAPGRTSPGGSWAPFPFPTDPAQSVALADAGTASDAFTVAAAVPLTDVGSAVDALAVTAAVPLADAGGGNDPLTVAATVPLADTGAASDALSVAVTASLADTGAGAELLVALAQAALADAGAALEALGLTTVVALADAGTASDQLTVDTGGVLGKPLPDVGAAADALCVCKVQLRPGSGTTARPNTGTAIRPNTGTIDRCCGGG